MASIGPRTLDGSKIGNLLDKTQLMRIPAIIDTDRAQFALTEVATPRARMDRVCCRFERFK